MNTFWQDEFRRAMKTRRVTYAQLADRLKMSTPGVKKIFQKQDISLDRFHQICQFLRLDPADVLRREYRSGLNVKMITEEADQFFCKNPAAFHLYWCLAVEKRDLGEAISYMKLSKATTYKYLRKLDEFSLLQWEAADKISLPNQTPFLFDRQVACVMRFWREQAIATVTQCFSKPAPKNSLAMARYLSLPVENLELVLRVLRDELDRLSMDYPYEGPTSSGPSSKRGRRAPTKVLLCLLPES